LSKSHLSAIDLYDALAAESPGLTVGPQVVVSKNIPGESGLVNRSVIIRKIRSLPGCDGEKQFR
jgi:hypothetical protein